MNFDVVRQKVETVLRKLRIHDSFLIEVGTNERTISHKIAEYLQEEFPRWNVDCEYNRHRYDIKKLRQIDIPEDNVGWTETEAKTIYPDIIVHERGTDDRNLLVIEVKKSSNAESRQFDKDKITKLTKEEYSYRFGLLLEISMNQKADNLWWYTTGKMFYEQKFQFQAN